MRRGIFYDSDFKTFYIYCGSSLYAFAIGPELELEHLYWGKALEQGYDLRYQLENLRNLQFSTVFDRSSLANIQSAVVNLGSQNIPVQQINNPIATSKSLVDLTSLGHIDALNDHVFAMKRKTSGDSSWFDVIRGYFRGKGSRYLPYGSKDRTYVAENLDFRNLRLANLAFRLEFIERKLCKSVSVEDLLRHLGERSDPISTSSNPASLKPAPVSQVGDVSPTGGRNDSPYHRFDRPIGLIGKDNVLLEFSDGGDSGDFRPPTFRCTAPNGSSFCPLTYISHRIVKGKLSFDGLPAIRTISVAEATTLVITLENIRIGMEVDLVYSCIHKYDVVTRRTIYRNCSNSALCHPLFRGVKVLEIACSATLDFESNEGGIAITRLGGSWSNEFGIDYGVARHGCCEIFSSEGITGHEHQPFIAVSEQPVNERTGEVKGFALLYSGNFFIQSDLSCVGNLRINLGINPQCFKWNLGVGEEFVTPEVVLCRSADGLGGLSRCFHDIFRDHLMRTGTWVDRAIALHGHPPIILHTDKDTFAQIVTTAISCIEVGINAIVVDSGCFGVEGDWLADPIRFPSGLDGLCTALMDIGCGVQLGLCVRPELAAANSDIVKNNPSWILGVADRNLLASCASFDDLFVLDLSRDDVIAFLYDKLSELLLKHNITILKWDICRPITEYFSQNLSSQSQFQDETAHRYMLGLYKLLDRIFVSFPLLLLEMSACGGGRFDPGMLYYCPIMSTSQSLDAVLRSRILFGASVLYPSRCICTNISDSSFMCLVADTNVRIRFILAMCGSFCIGVNFETLDRLDRKWFIDLVFVYQSVLPVVQHGDLYRLWDPTKASKAAWMYVSRDKRRAVVVAFSVNSDHWNYILPKLKLQGLHPRFEYVVWEPFPSVLSQKTGDVRIVHSKTKCYQMHHSTVILTGNMLMNIGLPLKFYSLDDSILFVLTEKPVTMLPLPPQLVRQLT